MTRRGPASSHDLATPLIHDAGHQRVDAVQDDEQRDRQLENADASLQGRLGSPRRVRGRVGGVALDGLGQAGVVEDPREGVHDGPDHAEEVQMVHLRAALGQWAGADARAHGQARGTGRGGAGRIACVRDAGRPAATEKIRTVMEILDGGWP